VVVELCKVGVEDGMVGVSVGRLAGVGISAEGAAVGEGTGEHALVARISAMKMLWKSFFIALPSSQPGRARVRPQLSISYTQNGLPHQERRGLS